MNQDTNTSEGRQEERYLAFTLCNESYAIELLKVKEVIALTETTPIPQAPSYFKGIMNLRGAVISIIDLRMKLKMAKAETGPETSIIILNMEDIQLGMIVDSVDSVLALKNSDISDGADVQVTTNIDYIKGVARVNKKLVLILDLEKTLNAKDLQAMKRQPTRPAKAAA